MSDKIVVFTGPASTFKGESVIRKDLIEAAEKCGWRVRNVVDAKTTLLVASRFDTVKVKRADALGVKVCDYGTFIACLQVQPVAAGASQSTPDLFVDDVPGQQKAPVGDVPTEAPANFL